MIYPIIITDDGHLAPVLVLYLAQGVVITTVTATTTTIIIATVTVITIIATIIM